MKDLENFEKLDLDFQLETICNVERSTNGRPDGNDDYTGLTVMTTYLI